MNNMTTFTPYLKKKYSDDREGIINIRVTKNRKSKYYSTKIVLKEKYWNNNKNEIRSNCPDYERLNKVIDDKVLYLNGLYFVADDVINIKKKKSIVQFYQDHINLLIQQNKIGTSKNTNTSFSRLKDFLKYKGINDVLFDEVSIDFVEQYEIYLMKRGISNNTLKKYVSILGRIFNLAIKKQVFKPEINPFITFQNNKITIEKPRLTKLELEYLINTEINPNDNLNKTKNMFLFQIFAQGMRVSDLLTLRWSNINDDRIDFYQFKTKKKLTVKINFNLALILKDFILGNCEDVMNCKYSFEMEGKNEMTYQELKVKYKSAIKPHLLRFGEGDKVSIEYVEKWKAILDKVVFIVHNKLIIEIIKYAKENKNSFIVDLLKIEDFNDIKFDGSQSLSKFQYNQISSKTTVYNRQLKKIQELVGIKTTMTSHLARHTYTNLLIELTNNDIYSISKSLGHNRLATTEHYLDGFSTSRMDRVNDDMSELFK